MAVLGILSGHRNEMRLPYLEGARKALRRIRNLSLGLVVGVGAVDVAAVLTRRPRVIAVSGFVFLALMGPLYLVCLPRLRRVRWARELAENPAVGPRLRRERRTVIAGTALGFGTGLGAMLWAVLR